MSSATQTQYLNRYKNAARLESFYGGLVMPETEEGKPNYEGFWIPLLILSFALGIFVGKKLYSSAANV